jgi:hypothetical protein
MFYLSAARRSLIALAAAAFLAAIGAWALCAPGAPVQTEHAHG